MAGQHPQSESLISRLAPGILVAATGVGAGDLAGGALAGSRLGLACLWVVLVGAALKYVLCEGLARWQLSTGRSVTNGVFDAAPPVVRWLFLLYVGAWSVCIGGMLMSACGECAQSIVPLGSASQGRFVHGCLHSLLAIVLVRFGGFPLFEKLMTVCIGVMFFTVLFVATLSGPDPGALVSGLFVPRVPDASGRGITWTLTLLAGVGGTLTMLCYGTWIREKGRTQSADLGLCRLDLMIGYLMTAVFGIAMVILGSQLPVDETLRGANLITSLSGSMERELGRAGAVSAWVFRIGAWGAVFSSLLGVWQSVPQLVCDMLPLRADKTPRDAGSREYLIFLLVLGIVPCTILGYSLATVQKIAGVTGAVFIPLFALALLLLPRTDGGRQAKFVHGWIGWIIMVGSLLLFGFLAWQKVADTWQKAFPPPPTTVSGDAMPGDAVTANPVR